MSAVNNQRGPMGLKCEKPAKAARQPMRRVSKRKAKEDREGDPYLSGVRSLPCIICEAFGEVQNSPTEAHHPICGRFSTRRAPHHHAIPLCGGHHQGDFDTSKTAIHRDRAEWVELYGEDHEYTEVTQDRLAHLLTRPEGQRR